MKKNKKNNKKFNLKSLKKLNLKNRKVLLKIIILFVIVVIILLSIFSISLIGKNKSNFPKPTEERARELLNNSYIYYVLSSGNVPLNGAELLLDDKKFYGIEVDVHSLTEIERLLKDSFSEITYDNLYNDVYGNPKKTFTEERNNIYISKVTPNEKCKDIKLDGTTEIYKRNGKYYIKYTAKDKLSSSEREIVYENSKWVLINPIKLCFND